MSKIALPIAELKPALTGLGKVISKRCTLPVLQHVKIERTADGWLAITATDLDTFVTVRLEQPSEGNPVSMLVPYDELLKITKNCGKTDNILLGNGEKDSVTIEYAIGGQIAEAKVESLRVEEFPAIPRMKGESIPLNNALRQSIQDALECASVDPTRMVINGACLDVSKPKAHYVVGTNGSHLFSSNSFDLPLKDSLIIPSSKFIDWKEFNNDGEWQLKVQAGETKDAPAHLQISSRRWRFITRQIEGNYPNWRQGVPDPKTAKTTLALDPQTLKSLITTIERMPCHDEAHGTIGLKWKGGHLHLLGKAPNADKWMQVPVEAQGMGQEIMIFLNRHYLVKALSFGLNTIELSNPKGYLRFFEGGRQMIVVPLNPDVGNPSPQTPRPKEPEGAKAEAPAEPQPAATSPAAPQERTTMPSPTNGNGSHTDTTEKPTLENALEKIEVVKGSYREAIRGLNDLTDTLRQVHRDQKASEREVQSARATLGKLQSVKL